MTKTSDVFKTCIRMCIQNVVDIRNFISICSETSHLKIGQSTETWLLHSQVVLCNSNRIRAPLNPSGSSSFSLFPSKKGWL